VGEGAGYFYSSDPNLPDASVPCVTTGPADGKISGHSIRGFLPW